MCILKNILNSTGLQIKIFVVPVTFHIIILCVTSSKSRTWRILKRNWNLDWCNLKMVLLEFHLILYWRGFGRSSVKNTKNVLLNTKKLVLPGLSRRLSCSSIHLKSHFTSATSTSRNQTFCSLLVLGNMKLQVWLPSCFWRVHSNHLLIRMCFILHFIRERSTC